MAACLPRRPDGGIPGRSDNRRPSNLLAWNSLPLPAPPVALGSKQEEQRGQGHPEPPRPPTPKAQGHEATGLETSWLLGNFRMSGRLRWASADDFEGPSPQVAQRGKGRAGERSGLAQGHPGDASRTSLRPLQLQPSLSAWRQERLSGCWRGSVTKTLPRMRGPQDHEWGGGPLAETDSPWGSSWASVCSHTGLLGYPGLHSTACRPRCAMSPRGKLRPEAHWSTGTQRQGMGREAGRQNQGRVAREGAGTSRVRPGEGQLPRPATAPGPTGLPGSRARGERLREGAGAGAGG